MAQTYYFYDLETSGLDPRSDRIMQFAGQRTDENFQPIGEPHNVLITLAEDTLPSPHALMVTGITPQKTVEEGYSEREFCEIFMNEIATPDTIMLGFNNIRFDDEFMRALLWRNYQDPYEWTYSDGRSRWDMLDVVRMTRALRPDGITWPVVDGKPTNRLELLSAENGIEHTSAHDALSDVNALIGVTKLIADKQPQLFAWLKKLRDKNQVKQLVDLSTPQPFVYSSGRYDAAHEKTTVAYPLAPAEHGNVLVYDLRHDPTQWVDMSTIELRKIANTPYKERDESYQAIPVKKLQYNRCPAVAPLGVLEQDDGWSRIDIDQKTVQQHMDTLRQHPQFARTIEEIIGGRPDYPKVADAEGQLYDGFVSPRDKLRSETVRNANASDLAKTDMQFDDARLAAILPRYKARNLPTSMSDDDRGAYEAYRNERLSRQARPFAEAVQQLAARSDLTDHQQFVLEELQLWYQAIMPAEPDS